MREEIRRRVERGELVDASGRLMTESELVHHFGVSRITIRTAIRPLVEAGMFARSPGRGTYLRSNRPEHWVGRLMGFSETVREAGYTPGARVLHQGMTNRHDAGVRERMGLRATWELKRLRLADDAPIAIEHAFYPPEIGLDLESRDLTEILMYRVFEQELGLSIRDAEQSIGATLAGKTDAALLDTTPGSALIAMERLTRDADGRPIEFLRSLYRPEFYRFSIHLTRRAP
ncbi:GntR family transcriptional regulator [Methylobacterium oryzisoli]|uniref:GntR family transcriptional regulator n=1 Tax=Methylobacterium oryzisoli TaxID=3385502 RepID=UPI003891DAD6